ncbi:MAG TPA: RsmB/NOP family class I SAM-dependent RNA methyltransferase [Fimbriimonadaceae bacterium]|nr:RsmB/NOP family class I SAM-dependent RNA methyltransferase [Fimbriimonadaceae bacterium]
MAKRARTAARREPGVLLMRQATSLFEDERVREEFVHALLHGIGREHAIIVLEDKPELRVLPRQGAASWQPDWVIRIAADFRAAKHPLHEKGAFYSLDFSSVFSASAMLAIADPPRRVLDLCASPGGKAIFAFRAFKPEILACNETIRKRTGSLIANLTRCKVVGSQVWSTDPSVYARRWPGAFDLVIVDAPCSGQSLMAKGDPAPGCFLPHMIDMCVGRQRRITGNAYHCIRPGGHLLYSTCTFTPKENEKVIAWLLEEYPDLEAVEIPALAAHRSHLAAFACYRLYPQDGFGAGAFTCLLRRGGEPPAHRPSLDDLPASWKYGQEATPLRRMEPR